MAYAERQHLQTRAMLGVTERIFAVTLTCTIEASAKCFSEELDSLLIFTPKDLCLATLDQHTQRLL